MATQTSMTMNMFAALDMSDNSESEREHSTATKSQRRRAREERARLQSESDSEEEVIPTSPNPPPPSPAGSATESCCTTGEEKPPARKLDETAWPTLGSEPVKKEEPKSAPSTGRKCNKKGNKKKGKVTSFIVMSSRIEALKRERADAYRKRNSNDPRTRAFERLQNKEEMAKSLKATKPCHFVLPKQTEDSDEIKFGVCYREHCTFAHSKEELCLPECAFGAKCYRFNGTVDRRTGKVNQKRKCQFWHKDKETEEEFYTRTGRSQPLLPETSEKSRQPKPRKEKTPGKRERREKTLGRPPQSTLRAPAKKLDLSVRKLTRQNTSSTIHDCQWTKKNRPSTPVVSVDPTQHWLPTKKTVIKVTADQAGGVFDMVAASPNPGLFEVVIV